jgi:ABC-type Mn2+/Zn2+ transport system permease subunit
MQDFLYRIEILQNVLIAGPIIGAVCSLLSVYIVLRRMALISEGVSHAAFGGFGAAILLGYWIPAIDNIFGWQFVAGIFCVATAFLIGFVTRKKRVSEDSAIGIFLVTSVAAGQLLLRTRQLLGGKAPPNVESLLFGSFADIRAFDVWLLAGVLAAVGLTIGLLYYQFLYTTLDEEMARINGVNTRFINTLLLFMISLVIVVSVRMVGSLIITALMIIPGATANMLSRKFSGVLIASLLIGTLGTSAATALSLVKPLDRFTTGPLIVLLLFVVFAAVWAYRNFVKPRPVNPDAAGAVPQRENPSSFGHGHSH